MKKHKQLVTTTSMNFALRSRPSFFIGTYLIVFALVTRAVLSGFITDASAFSFLTVDLLEMVLLLFSLLLLLFGLLALFFGNRSHLRSMGYALWNRNSKKVMWLLFLLLGIGYTLGLYLLRNGYELYIIPTCIVYYGFMIIGLNFSKHLSLYLFSLCCICIGFLPLCVDSFGLYSIGILGIAHYIFSYIQHRKRRFW